MCEYLLSLLYAHLLYAHARCRFASDPSSPALWSYNGPRIASFLDVSGGTGFILVGGEGDELVRMK